MMGLTPRQARCKAFIAEQIAANGVAPSYDEIMEGLGTSSRSEVFHIVSKLVERGHVRRIPNRARALEVVGVSPTPADLEAMAPQELRHLIALASGILAHKTGGGAVDSVLNRIGARLAGRPVA